MPASRNNPTHIGRVQKDWPCKGCGEVIPAGSAAVFLDYIADGRWYRTAHFHLRCGEGIRTRGAELDAMHRRHTDELLQLMADLARSSGLPGDTSFP